MNNRSIFRRKRTWVVIFLLACLHFYVEYPMCEYGKIHGELNPWIFSLLSADCKYEMFLFFGAITIFSSMVKPEQKTDIGVSCLRTELRSVVSIATEYTALCYILSILPMLGTMRIEWSWGELLQGLLYEDLPIFSPNLTIDLSYINYFNPVEATIAAILLFWNTCVFLGLATCVFTCFDAVNLGVFFSLYLVFLSNQISLYPSPYACVFSPVSWAQITTNVPVKMRGYIWHFLLLTMVNWAAILVLELTNESCKNNKLEGAK